MAAQDLTDEQLAHRLDMMEKLIARADTKDLPYHNDTFQKLLDEQVRRDLLKTKEPKK
jgi:ribosome-binding protein aMBF1 (putative translation factor)